MVPRAADSFAQITATIAAFARGDWPFGEPGMKHANLTHWAERVDMAAAFRWTVRLNLHEAVANHFSLAVNPGWHQAF